MKVIKDFVTWGVTPGVLTLCLVIFSFNTHNFLSELPHCALEL
jgi:hypothetical protein